MSRRTKLILASAGSVVAIGVVVLLLFGEQFGGIPIIGEIAGPTTCPLNGAEPDDDGRIDRPAVAIKVENAQVAYPLSGLDKAELVYEEVVEGGVTRFMAIYHCNDATKIGPVRSARVVDPGIMIPITRILSYSGENQPVLEELQDSDIVRITEENAKNSMRRIPRSGLTAEHTLYANSEQLRKLGAEKYDDPPPEEVFEFGDLTGDTKRAQTIEIEFSELAKVRYEYSGGAYKRFQPPEQPFEMDGGDQLSVENVVIEEHVVNLSRKIRDVEGNPSTEIADETGKGKAILFRDGRAIEGSWIRSSDEDLVRFEAENGEQMVFAEGNVWIHLVPNEKGEVTSTYSFK